jgi:hypothetical protein
MLVHSPLWGGTSAPIPSRSVDLAPCHVVKILFSSSVGSTGNVAWVFGQRASSLWVRGSSGGCLFGRVRGSSGGALLLSGYVGLPGAVSSAGCVGLPAVRFFSPGTWVFRRLFLRPGAWVFRQRASSLWVRGSSGGCLFGRVRGSSGGALLLSGYGGLPEAVSSAGCVGLPAVRFFSPGMWVFRLRSVFVHARRDRWCLDGCSAVSRMGE